MGIIGADALGVLILMIFVTIWTSMHAIPASRRGLTLRVLFGALLFFLFVMALIKSLR